MSIQDITNDYFAPYPPRTPAYRSAYSSPECISKKFRTCICFETWLAQKGIEHTFPFSMEQVYPTFSDN
jgi:hypothetical protein